MVSKKFPWTEFFISLNADNMVALALSVYFFFELSRNWRSSQRCLSLDLWRNGCLIYIIDDNSWLLPGRIVPQLLFQLIIVHYYWCGLCRLVLSCSTGGSFADSLACLLVFFVMSDFDASFSPFLATMFWDFLEVTAFSTSEGSINKSYYY